jgi:hypothetical protein
MEITTATVMMVLLGLKEREHAKGLINVLIMKV